MGSLGPEPAPDPEWLVEHPWAFPVFFVAMWTAVTTLLGWMSGLTGLAARYPAAGESDLEETFHFASGKMGVVSYSSALRIGIGRKGLHISASWLFRPPFQRKIPCVPWRELKLLRAQRGKVSGFFFGTKVEVPAAGVTFSVGGRAGRAIERKLASARGS